MAHARSRITKNIVRSLDGKCISVVLKLQISMRFQGLRQLHPDPKPPVVKMHNMRSLHAKPSNFREA